MIRPKANKADSGWKERKGSFSLGQTDKQEQKRTSKWRAFFTRILKESSDELLVILAASLGALVRAMGVQVQSGYAGLLFTNGRAGKILDHGFRPLIPFLQQVVIVPIRSRTMDLPSQKVVNLDGLVYIADANLVYHVHDVRKAVIEIDVLEKGMLQMLTLGVQEVLRSTTKQTIVDTAALGESLKANLNARLGEWGVTVDKAGFPTLSPSPRSLRITQLMQQIDERQKQFEGFRDLGHGSPRALAMVGTRRFPQTIRKQRIKMEFARSLVRRRRKLILKRLKVGKKKKKKKKD